MVAFPIRPAGVFHHVGTHISAVVAIAQSAGGYLIPDPSETHLKVRALYPVALWRWGSVTPDVVLPADAASK